MQRVLHVVGLRGYGGLEKLFVAYALGMHEAGRPVATALKHSVHPAARSLLASASAQIYRQKYLGPLRLPGRGLQAANRQRILRAARPDSVVFWSSLPTPGWLDACNRRGIAVIYYDHGRSWQLDRTRSGPLLGALDRVVTVSHAGARIMIDRLGYDGPVSVVHNGVTAPQAHTGGVPSRQRVRIAFAGRLVDKKGVPLLVHAASNLRDRGIEFHVSIAGDGPARPGLKALADKLGLSEQITFEGLVVDLGRLFRSADIVVMPSLQEPFGLTAVEAGLHGIPVVAAGVDGLTEVVSDGESGVLVPPTLSLSAYEALGGGRYQVPEQVYDPLTDQLAEPRAVDPVRLADTLADLASDRDRLQAMGQAASVRCRELFSFEGYLHRINEAFEGPGKLP